MISFTKRMFRYLINDNVILETGCALLFSQGCLGMIHRQEPGWLETVLTLIILSKIKYPTWADTGPVALDPVLPAVL